MSLVQTTPYDSRTQMNVRRSLGITDAKIKLGQLVDEVYYQGDTVLLEKSGRPVAIVVPVGMYRSWQARKDQGFGVIRKVQASIKGKFTEKAAMSLALEAQQAVRRKQSKKL